MKLNMMKTSVLLVVLALTGCETVSKTTRNLTDNLNFSNKEAPTYRAVGYATISQQMGLTRGEKVIAAIEASKANAYKELVAMVHGRYLSSNSTVDNKVIVTDSFNIAEAGIVRGARVVKSYPIQDDVYATILEVSSEQQKAWIINND
ncbi:hypothetical protein WN093_16735 [Gammaproteobacteria bacterium AS21]|jgi:hypothetical protein